MANKRIKGGKMNGPKHKDGGIKIEVEGGEIIINKSIITFKYLEICCNLVKFLTHSLQIVIHPSCKLSCLPNSSK